MAYKWRVPSRSLAPPVGCGLRLGLGCSCSCRHKIKKRNSCTQTHWHTLPHTRTLAHTRTTRLSTTGASRRTCTSPMQRRHRRTHIVETWVTGAQQTQQEPQTGRGTAARSLFPSLPPSLAVSLTFVQFACRYEPGLREGGAVVEYNTEWSTEVGKADGMGLRIRMRLRLKEEHVLPSTSP